MILAPSARHFAFRARFLAVAFAAGLALVSPAPSLADAESSNEYYEDALDWLQKGDFRAAVIQLRNALQQDEDNHSARLLLGRLYLQSGNLPAARKELEYVHQNQPTDESEVFLARTLLGLRDYAQVLQIVREQADDPQFASPKRMIRAEALAGLGRLDEAKALASELVDGEATGVPANLLMARIAAAQEGRAAAERYIEAALIAKPDLVDAHLLRAQLALRDRDIDRVLDVADTLQEVAPNDPRGIVLRAEALVRRNDLQEAETVLTALLEQNPNVAAAVYLKARVLMLMGRYEAADQELLKLPENMRRQPAVSLIEGLVKYQLGQFGQAEDALVRFTSSAGSENRQARRLLASIQLQTDRPRAALQTLATLTGSESSDVASLQLSASAAIRADELETAVENLRRVAAIGSESDRNQAVTFLRLLDTGKRNEAGTLVLDPVALGVLRALDTARFGDSDGALAQAEALYAEAPDNVGVANLLARLHLAQGNLEKARAVLDPVLKKEPAQVATLTNMNRIDVSEGKFEAVESRLRAALEAAPENEAIILQLAQFLANRGRQDEAVRLMEEKAAALPASLALRRNLIAFHLREQNAEAVRKYADETRAIGATTNPAGLNVAGDAYLALENYTAATEVFAEWREKAPDQSAPLLKLAQAQFLDQDQAAAEETLETVLADEPANLAANRALIALHLGNEDDAAAMAVADRAGEGNPVLGSVLRANVFQSTGRLPEATEELQTQLAKTPSTGLVRQVYALLIAAGKREEAATLLASWLSENPDDAVALQLLSAQYIQDQQYEPASVLLERAYSLQPNDVIVLNNLAWLRYELERPGARELARRAYRIAPNRPAIADTLGWILVREGEFAEGLKLLYAAADAAPENNDIAYHVAFALNKTGKSAEAVELLTRILAEPAEENTFTERAEAKRLLAELQDQ